MDSHSWEFRGHLGNSGDILLISVLNCWEFRGHLTYFGVELSMLSPDTPDTDKTVDQV